MLTTDTKPKILYVDDEHDNVLVFKSSFRRNYNIITASSATEALELLKENPVEIIISDQRMPEISGVEFLKSLPDEPENIRMILTGYSDMEAIIDAMNSGKVFKYITKPWSKSELQNTIDETLQLLYARKDSRLQIEGIKAEKQLIDHLLESQSGSDTESGVQLEVLKYKKQLDLLNKRVSESEKSIQLLSEIGQEIISNLTIDAIIDSTYETVNSLMPADTFGIGIFNPENKNIEFPGLIDEGKKIPFSVPIDTDNRYAVWCYKNRKEVFVNNHRQEFKKYFNQVLPAVSGSETQSVIYLPLIVKESLIGVITVQAIKPDSYSNYQLNLFRNIAIYVAIALENAKAYSLIEEHKHEIEEKNIELEQKVLSRTTELQQKNLEVLKQKDELEATYSNVKLLSEIGQQITSTLSLERIVETVYENVNSLMDATIFTIGVYNPKERSLEFLGTMEKGEKLPFHTNSLDDENRLAVWCFNNNREIIINDQQTEYNKYVKSIAKPKVGEVSESIIYLPLITNEGPIGVITVQSFRKHIYTSYHIDILRSLGSYITIAIQNSTSYQKMTKAFEDLKSTQMKLVESERMASLGVMTAGVAHEINNPVNFISAGIESLNMNYQDFKKLVRKFMEYNGNNPDQNLWLEIEQLKEELVPFDMMLEMDELLDSIKNGANRTAEIVKGLRNFTRMDENEMKLTRVEEGIDSTLIILNNQLKSRIEIVKEYVNLDPIMGYPGQLNQVFMNILHNAAQAIDKKGTITIKTYSDAKYCYISIKDDGSGMPENVRAHIFEPFYTTKEVGKGTGLGLSIAYGIIEKHKGKIEVLSEIGKGTEFIISLPLNN